MDAPQRTETSLSAAITPAPSSPAMDGSSVGIAGQPAVDLACDGLEVAGFGRRVRPID